MRNITNNVRYKYSSDKKLEVEDIENKVKVTVPQWVVLGKKGRFRDVNGILEMLQYYYSKDHEPHFNICAQLPTLEIVYFNEGQYQMDPLCYREAYNPQMVREAYEKVREKYVRAWTEEVKPFQQ